MRDGKLVSAQIGCGKFAHAQDLPNMREHDGIVLKWTCDVNRSAADSAMAEFGAERGTDDFMEIVADPEVDFVKVATSHEAHLPIIEAAAKAGKHIFCEKPMAMSESESYAIMRAVRRNGVKLCVDLNRRMSPALQALRRRFLSQRAEPRHQPWQYIETVREPLPEEKRAQLLIRIQDESSSYGMVHLDPVKGGGLIIGETVHWLDLACWFFGPQYPVEITAWGGSRLSHGVNLLFSGGDNAVITFTCAGTFCYPKELYEATVEASLMRSLFFVENNYYGIPNVEREYFRLQEDPYAELGDGFEAYMRKFERRTQGADSLKRMESATPFIVDKGHKAMLDAFVRSIIDDTPSPCDELAGFRSTYLAQLAIQALRLKQTLPVPLEVITPNLV
ncbi:MAG: Gfo/Idh/MocA family oxidoreductase [Victivallales bacterium]|nr:Gfo/Idh/MocA family oxidoreductase [Victivallales bacterium]